MRHWKLLFAAFIISLPSCKDQKGAEETLLINEPVILAISPNTGNSGSEVAIQGMYFGEEEKNIEVLFGDRRVDITQLSSSLINVIVPDLSGKVTVSIRVNELVSNGLVFTYIKQPQGEDYATIDKQKIKELLLSSDPAVYIFTGNSITQGAKHTHGLRAYSELFGEQLHDQLARYQDIVINTAISGHTTRDILKDFDWRIAKYCPTIVFLMAGTNDAATTNGISREEFANNLSLLIDKIRNIGAVPVLVSPPIIITEKAKERSLLPSYVSKITEVAEEEKVVFVDIWKFWNNDLQIKYQNQVFKYLLNDPLHPNGMGHKEIADFIFKELSISDNP